jgi:Flp pilus assembly pilin Flp
VPVRADTTSNIPDYRDERGVAMVEYSLLLALVALVAFALASVVGADTLDLYTQIGNAIHDLAH